MGRMNDATVFTKADGTSYVSLTTTGASQVVDCRNADYVTINLVLASTGTVQVQVASNNVAGEFTSFGSSFTASGNLTIDPAFPFVRLSVTANGSGLTAYYSLGQRR